MRILINGQRWSRRLVKRIVAGGVECLGKCYYDEKVIRIRRGQSPRDEFGTDIHETAHGVLPDLDESAVVRLEAALVELLFDKLRYRKQTTRPKS